MNHHKWTSLLALHSKNIPWNEIYILTKTEELTVFVFKHLKTLEFGQKATGLWNTSIKGKDNRGKNFKNPQNLPCFLCAACHRRTMNKSLIITPLSGGRILVLELSKRLILSGWTHWYPGHQNWEAAKNRHKQHVKTIAQVSYWLALIS